MCFALCIIWAVGKSESGFSSAELYADNNKKPKSSWQTVAKIGQISNREHKVWKRCLT